MPLDHVVLVLFEDLSNPIPDWAEHGAERKTVPFADHALEGLAVFGPVEVTEQVVERSMLTRSPTTWTHRIRTRERSTSFP